MAVRVRSSADHVEAPRYEELDRLLDIAEPALHTIAAEHGLHQARVDRWRWDQPEVVLSWVDRDRQDIGKSIRFYIDEEDGFFLCSVECNAWRDRPDKAGRPVRRWRHEAIGSWRVRGAEGASANPG